MRKKGSIELSANFLVNLIFGIVLFLFGLFFITKMIPREPPYEPPTLDMQIEQCINSGQKVCLPELRKEIRVRKSDQFKLIVNNILDEKSYFRPFIFFSNGLLSDKSLVNSGDIEMSEWTLNVFRNYEIENNAHEEIDIPVTVPSGTKKGTYFFNVVVCHAESEINSKDCVNNMQYSPVLQFTVEVK